MQHKYPEIADYDYVLSSVGNAYFSGVTFGELWDCVAMSENREQLDAAVSATIKFKDLTNSSKKAKQERRQKDE